MHIFFSGIGGTAISSLALIAHKAGYEVSGSDARPSHYLEYLKKHGISNTHIGVDREFIASVHAKNPIDWFVYGSAQPMDFPDHPEFAFCDEMGIKQSKRDEFLSGLITQNNLKLIAVAGTHGKTTTTAMATWVFKQLGLPLSYSGGAKLSFGDLAEFDPASRFFIYEADEYDHNFLSFYPEIALISGVDWDHPDIYPTRESYYQAFNEFIDQSKHTVVWRNDAERLELAAQDKLTIVDDENPEIDSQIKLAGHVNRLNAWLVASGLAKVLGKDSAEIVAILNKFPGVSRRFEEIKPNLYTDSAHTPEKIRGALQLAHEVAGNNVVVVYEGLHNTRQHFIKDELKNLFEGVKKVYVVPTYLAREDPSLELLTPQKIVDLLAPHQNLSGAVGNRIAEHQAFGEGLSNSSKPKAHASALDTKLKQAIDLHLSNKDLVLCLSAGGAGSLDEWLRDNY